MLIDEGAIKIGEGQAKKLHDWLAGHQQDCFNTFNDQVETGVIAPTSWLVNDGNNDKWPALKNFKITLESAQVSSVWLPPDDKDYLSCIDNDFNNTEVFEENIPVSPGINEFAHLSASQGAMVEGPVLLESRVTGVAELSSYAQDCRDPWCSFLEITSDSLSGVWTLEELQLHAHGSVSLVSEEFALALERSSLRLYDVSHGDIYIDGQGSEFQVIAPNEAHFIISGASSQTYGIRWGRNVSPIVARRNFDNGGWLLEEFVVQHVDSDGEVWTLTIPSTSWF